MTEDDWLKLLENQEVFIKHLKKTKLNYQIELSRWTYRGKEELLYRSMETIDEVIKSLESVEDAFNKRNKAKEQD